MEYLLGIDLGTSYFKFSLVDRSGSLRGLAREAVPVNEPLPGRQEVDATEFWRVVASGIASAARAAGAQPREIGAVGYSSQANSFILLDRRDRPLTPIILWSDERAAAPGRELRELWERSDFLPTTGMAVSGPGLAAAKLDWIRREAADLFKESARVLTISDYLTYCLTGEAAGDESTGSLLGLRELQAGRWWPEGLSATGLRESQMAHLLRPGSPVGKTVGAMAEAVGLPRGALFTVGSLDHYAAAVGSGLGFHGDTSESTGTVLACLHLHPEYRPDPAYCTGPTAEEGRWYRLAFGPDGARSLEWLSGKLPGAHTVEELARLAGTVEPGAGGLYAPAAAYIYPDLSCFAAAGQAGGSGARPTGGAAAGEYARAAGEYARAAMESSARSLGALLASVCPDGAPPHLLSTGGGARSDTWLQIKADMLDLEVRTAAHAESGALGASIFAAVGAGWHASLAEAVGALVSIERRFLPDPAAHRAYAAWNDRYPGSFRDAPPA